MLEVTGSCIANIFLFFSVYHLSSSHRKEGSESGGCLGGTKSTLQKEVQELHSDRTGLNPSSAICPMPLGVVLTFLTLPSKRGYKMLPAYWLGEGGLLATAIPRAWLTIGY